MGIMQRVRDGDYSHLLRKPPEFAARKRRSRADDSKSKECTRPDGTKYRIPIAKVCGGAKTQKKQVETPKAKAAAAGVKKEADKIKQAGSFKGAIGGFKSGKTYDVTPEMSAFAQKMGVSDRQLANGRVPKSVQADLIKEFDRLSAGGKPETSEKGGAIVPTKSALQRAQEETDKRKARNKTPEEKAKQFERLAGALVDTIMHSKDRIERLGEEVTPKQLKANADNTVKRAQAAYDAARNSTAKDLIKKIEAGIKEDRALQREFKARGVSVDLTRSINRQKAMIKKLKADPEGEVNRRIESEKKLLDRAIEAANIDFDAKAKNANRERNEVLPQMTRLIEQSQNRLQKVWEAGATGNASLKEKIAMSFFGVKPSGDPQADMKIARDRFRDIARLEHPDMGGDPQKFQKAAKMWQDLRASQAVGGTPPLIDPMLQARMEAMGYKFPSLKDMFEDLGL